jgi:hypothetical protein
MSQYGELSKLLDHRVLTGMIRKEVPVPRAGNRIFTMRTTVRTKEFSVDITGDTRTPAPYTGFGGVADRVATGPVGDQKFTMGNIFVAEELDEETLSFLRSPGTEHESYAAEKIRGTIARLNKKIDYSVEKAQWDTIQGALSINKSTDPQNPIRVTSTIPVTHIGSDALSQWNSPIATEWSSPGRRILTTGISGIEDVYRDIVGLPLSQGWCNRSVSNFVINNLEVQNWYRATVNTVITTGMIGQLRNWSFNEYDEGFAATENNYAVGAVSKFIANSTLILLPEGNRIEATMYEGLPLIPTGPMTIPTVGTPGRFSYAVTTFEPIGVTIYAGYRFVPVIKWPEAVLVVHLT